MIKETIYGQVVAKANHYKAVPGKNGERRIIKDQTVRNYETSFCLQCRTYKGKQVNRPFRFVVDVYNIHSNFDLDNSIKTILDCLQYCDAITNDNLLVELQARKHVSKTPRVEFGIEVLQKDLFDIQT